MKKIEDKVVTSWQKNAQEWIRVMDNSEIGSRNFTDGAIIRILTDLSVRKIVDLGCGEGWLTRKISQMGKTAIGIDVTASLLANAREKGTETYYRMDYSDIILGNPIPEAPYDVAVFNFSIYQKEGLAKLLEKVKTNLVEDGYLVIQTLHPFYLPENNLGYKSQPIDDSWKGLKGNFVDGHQWYARTFTDWISLFKKSELNLFDIQEVSNDDQRPVSVIFVLN